MSKTYVLQSTEMHCGYRASIASGYWNGFIGSDSIGMWVGMYRNNYRLINILFDQTKLSSLRSKTVTSIKLTLTFESGGTIYGSSDTKFPIGYKLNATPTTATSGDAWTRSNADSTDEATTTIGYIRSAGDQYTISAGNSLTIDLTGSKVPVYGYVLGTYQGSGYSYHLASSATLTVVTTETDYTIKLSYNANGGSGAPATQSQSITTAGTPSVTFTISSTEPTRSGFFFRGWKTGSTVYQPGASITVSANTTLLAQWAPAESVISSVTSSVPITGESLTGKLTVNITRYDSSFTHNVKITLGSRTTTLTGQGTTVEYVIPVSWLDQIPDATSKSASVEVTTKSGSTTIGESSSATFTATVPADVLPTVTLASENVNTNTTIRSWGILLQGYSKIKLTASASAGAGASLKKIVFSGDQISQSGLYDTVTSGILTTTGARTWKVVVTDSRNRTANATISGDVVPYSGPAIGNFATTRSNSSGAEAPDDGTYASAKADFSFSSVNNLNSLTSKKIYYKLQSDSSWTEGVSDATSGTWYTFGGGNISTLYVYDVKCEITDAIGNTATVSGEVNSIVGFAIGLKNDRARFGGPVQQPGLQVDWNAEFESVVDVVNRRASASLSSTGWYRVCSYEIGASGSVTGGHGFAIRFNIQRHTSAENHSITLRAASSLAIIWCDESSHSTTKMIDKIRYTYNPTTYFGYVDIHYSTSGTRGVCVDFDVHESGNNRANVVAYLEKWKTKDLEPVADAPAGETIVSTHTFSADAVVPNLPILTSNGDLSKTGNLLSLDPGTVSVPNSTWTEMGSLTLTPGIWLITYLVYFGSTNTDAEGRRRIIVTNSSSGTTPISFYMADERPAIAGVYSYCNATFVYNITSQASKTVYFKAYQTSGVSKNVSCQIQAVQIS